MNTVHKIPLMDHPPAWAHCEPVSEGRLQLECHIFQEKVAKQYSKQDFRQGLQCSVRLCQERQGGGDSLFSYLMERVRNNLHIVLCMSPVGETFRKKVNKRGSLSIPTVHPAVIYSPILWSFSFAVESLDKKDMTKIKPHGRPPALVETVMQAVVILQGKEPTWAGAKSQLGERQQQHRMKG
ncbi:dynein axonemal heavy chain 2 [Lates japonicus]|uniref:Dynein axonemal heavy chain 2 n=1 Tax=Lates japonicus TaxID=270547 RepID=A0AAD3MGZ3_LATJO|nr:dynein axonemal heavy chain 2 [Lates japonicus]